MTKLQRCPFCGGEPERSDCIGCGYIQIRCTDCGANITQTLATQTLTIEEATLIEKWTRRTD